MAVGSIYYRDQEASVLFSGETDKSVQYLGVKNQSTEENQIISLKGPPLTKALDSGLVPETIFRIQQESKNNNKNATHLMYLNQMKKNNQTTTFTSRN